jgi:putative two-component system response regulator
VDQTILIVEDNIAMREALQAILESGGYQVMVAEHGKLALEQMRNRHPDLILSDISMPEMDGFAFFDAVRANPAWISIPFIFLTARGERKDIFLGKQIGAEDYLVKPVLRQELLTTVAARLARSQEVVLAQMEKSYLAALSMLADAIEQRDQFSPPHVEHIVDYALAISKQLPDRYIDTNALYFGGVLHDIGKILIADDILHKESPLDDDEWGEVQRHPIIGQKLIENIPYLSPAIPVIRYHHERWDGQGYPEGLAGEAIPIEARIIAVADALETMLRKRIYRPPLRPSEAYQEILAGSGTRYDPEVVQAFSTAWDTIQAIITVER